LIPGNKSASGLNSTNKNVQVIKNGKGILNHRTVGMAHEFSHVDHDLKLKEIKIIKRAGYDNIEYNYDDLIKRILFSTEGRWIKCNNKDSSNWYFYYGSFNVR
jgi:hypothetical protein